ncbi:MAG: hypothetical protein EXS01_03780 [Phycisphaerales bacterium]|nr:hypothetical protein [Phycisphaerales bacterium]
MIERGHCAPKSRAREDDPTPQWRYGTSEFAHLALYPSSSMNFRRRKRAIRHEEAHGAEDSPAQKVMDHPAVPQGEPELIDTPAQLEAFMNHVRTEGSFAFDTEFIGEETFIPLICLIQLATRSRLALIDPFAFEGTTLNVVWEAVCDPTLLKIVHAGGQDINAAQRYTNRPARNVIDTQIAAGFIGMPWPSSLGNVVHAVAELRLNKGHTFTEWDSRPLSKSQLAYAADDVRYLPLVWQLQQERLDSLQRKAWAISESEESLRTSDEFLPESQVRRAARGMGLRPRVMTILRELVILRYSIAEAKNLPPRTVLPDSPMLEIARRKVATPEELSEIRAFPRQTATEFGAEIVRTIAAARELPIDRDRVWTVPEESAEDRTRIDALWSIISMRAISMGIATALILTRSELSRWYLARTTAPAPLFPLDSWRHEAIGKWLESFLDGNEILKLGWKDGGPIVP